MKRKYIVYAVIDETGEVLKDRTSFYFNKDYAKSAVKLMNEHISSKDKPKCKVKAFYLIEK